MIEDSPLAITVGEEIYVELGNGSTPQISQFMDVITNLQQELDHLSNNNEHLQNYSEDQERMIGKLTEKSNHKSMEPKGIKRKKMEAE